MNPYREMDAEARNYADPERAITAAKRRRRFAVAVTPVALAGLIGAVMVLRLVATGTPPPPAAEATFPTTATEAGTLRPRGQVMVLPSGPVGRAAFAYGPCRGDNCGTFVVLSDGRQFVLPPFSEEDLPILSIEISWDGRWLGHRSEGQYLVRSLTDGRVHRVKPEAAGVVVFPVAWSSDSRRLLLQLTDDRDATAGYTVLDVESGLTTRLTAPTGMEAFGIRPDGTVLFHHDGKIVAQSTSAGHTATIDVTSQLKDETVHSVFLAPDDRSVYVVTGNGEQPVVIHADFDGNIQGRYEVPKLDLENQYCDALGSVADGLAFTCRNGSGSRTVLTVVSAAGTREGVKLDAHDWPNYPQRATFVIPGSTPR
jgi:hypothetical protein